jgi:hypothetical protein
MKKFIDLEDYFEELKRDFEFQDPKTQRVLLKNLNRVLIVGCAIALSTFVYQFVPLLIRVFLFPAFIVGAYFVASQIEPTSVINLPRTADKFIRSIESGIRGLNPVLKNAPSMALMSGLLIISCSLAGFVWYIVAGR